MKLDILLNNLIDEWRIIALLSICSFVFGFLLGQGKQIVGFEFLGLLGWSIISLFGIIVLIGVIYTIYFTVKESSMAKEYLDRAIVLWQMEQQGRIKFKSIEEVEKERVGEQK